MLESRSAFGFVVHTPFGPRKSGMPDSVEIPAPVSATMRFDSTSQPRTNSTRSSISRPPGDILLRSILGGTKLERRRRSAMKRLAMLAGLSSLLAMPIAAVAQTEDHAHHAPAASSGVGTVSFETS